MQKPKNSMGSWETGPESWCSSSVIIRVESSNPGTHTVSLASLHQPVTCWGLLVSSMVGSNCASKEYAESDREGDLVSLGFQVCVFTINMPAELHPPPLVVETDLR